MTTEPTNIRLDAEAKAQAYAVFEQIGIKPSQAFNLFLHQVRLQGGIPFELKVPNAETLQAIQESDSRKNLSHYNDVDEMFDDILNHD
jgi:DNA-damage-inducible protein J